MKQRRRMFFVLTLLAAATYSPARENDHLFVEQIDLIDGRHLRQMTITSFDPETNRLLLTAAGGNVLLPLELVAKIVERTVDPASGRRFSFLDAKQLPTPFVLMDEDARQWMRRFSAISRAPTDASPGMADGQKLATTDEEILASRHRDVAFARARHFYKIEYSGARNAVAWTIELGAPEDVAGWAGRVRTPETVSLEFFDLHGNSVNRGTDTFEVITERAPSGEVKAVDLTRKT